MEKNKKIKLASQHDCTGCLACLDSVYRLPSFEWGHDQEQVSLAQNRRSVRPVELEPTLEREIKEAQKNDEKISEIRRLIQDVRGKDFREDAEGVIWFKDRMCVPNV